MTRHLRLIMLSLGFVVAAAVGAAPGCSSCSVADDCGSRTGMTIGHATSEDGKLCHSWGTTGSFSNGGVTVSYLDATNHELCACNTSNDKLTDCEGEHLED